MDDDALPTIFDKRMALFKHTPIHLLKFFSISFKGMEKKDTKPLILSCAQEMIDHYGYPQSEEAFIKYELAYFVANECNRGGLTIAQFFECSRYLDYAFKYLPKVYASIQRQYASSVAVERSFSEQGLIRMAKRNCLKHETLAELMIVKCNLQFFERQDGSSALEDYLFKDNPLRHYFK